MCSEDDVCIETANWMLFTQWETWSTCNSCGEDGERRRKGENMSTPNDSTHNDFIWGFKHNKLPTFEY